MSTVEEFLSWLPLPKLTPEQEERKRKLREISFEQACLTAQANAEAKESALSGLVGAEKQLREITACRQTAAALAGRGSFKDAFEKLAPVDDLHEEGVNAHRAVRKGAEAKFKPLFEAQRALEGKVAEDRWLLDEAKQEYRDKLAGAVAPLLAKNAGDEAVKTAKRDLQAIQQEIKDEVHAAERLASAAEFRRAEAAKALQALEQLGLLQDVAKVSRQKASADALFQQRQYADAIEAATAARDDAVMMQQEVEANQATWRAAEPNLAAALEECSAQASQGCRVVETISPTVKEVEAELKALQAKKVGVEIPYYTAIATLERCRNMVATNARRIDEYNKLNDVRAAADKKLQSAFNQTQSLIDKAEGKLSRLRDENVRLIEPPRRLAELRRQWSAAMDLASTPDALDTSGVEAELTAIESDVATATDTEDGQSAAYEASELASVMPSYERALAEARGKLAELREFGAAAANILNKDSRPAALEQRISANFARSQSPDVHPQQIVSGTQELKELAAAAAEGAALVAKESARRKAELDKSFKTTAYELQQLEEKLVRYATSFLTKSPEYEKYVKTLSGDLTAIDGMRDGKDLDMLELAEQELSQLLKRVRAANSGIDAAGSKGETLQAANQQVTIATDDLSDADLTNYLGSTKAELAESLEEIKSALLTTPVDVTLAKMVEWRKRFVVAQGKAREAKTATKAFLAAQKVAKKKLTDAKDRLLKDGAKELYERLLKQFDKLAAAAGSEGSLAQGQRDLELLSQKLNDVLTKPEVLQAQQGEAKKLADQSEEEQVRWKGLYDDYRQKLLPQVKAAKAQADLYKELVELGDSADKAFKRTKDFATAEFQLKHARERARAAIEFPEGLELAARNQLPKVQAQWKSAVANFHKKVAEVRKAVAAEDEAAAKSLDAPLKEVASLFNSGAFDAAIQTMLRPDASFDEKQTQREDALRNVRRFQRYVLNDYRLKELAANPFVKPFTGNFELNVALANLEKNLLTSL